MRRLFKKEENTMKNKKGFTLIEIIISITIITLLTGIPILLLRNSDNNDIEKYDQHIISNALVYFESNKNTSKFENLKETGDWTYIQLADLIDMGLLDANEYNPYRKTTNRESDFDLVKIYIDEEKNLMIQYPTEYIEKTKEELEKIIKNDIFIHLKNDEDEVNEFKLIDSLEMYKLSKASGSNIINEINSGVLYESDIYEPKNIFKNFKDFKDSNWWELRDFEENVIYLSEEEIEKNIEIKVSRYPESGKMIGWKYTFSIKSGSDLDKKYTFNDTNNERIVRLSDDDAPVLVSKSNKVYEYNIDNGDIIYAYRNDEMIGIDLNVSRFGYQEWEVFDNFDGLNSLNDVPGFDNLEEIDLYDVLDFDNLEEIDLCDDRNNCNRYDIDFRIDDFFKNEPPTYEYWGERYYWNDEIYYEDSKIYPFYDEIYIEDYGEDDISYYSIALYNKNWEYMFPNDYLYSGEYYLEISFGDDEYFYDEYELIYIDQYDYDDYYEDEYYEDDYYEDDYYYDDFCYECIIDEMMSNSEDWFNADDETREELHERNEELAEELEANGYDVYYDDSGYWYDEDDSYLYGDDYYDDYYWDAYYEDDYYDDYYYDDYYWDDYYCEDYWYDEE